MPSSAPRAAAGAARECLRAVRAQAGAYRAAGVTKGAFALGVVTTRLSLNQGLGPFEIAKAYGRYNNVLYIAQAGLCWYTIMQLVVNRTRSIMASPQNYTEYIVAFANSNVTFDPYGRNLPIDP